MSRAAAGRIAGSVDANRNAPLDAAGTRLHATLYLDAERHLLRARGSLAAPLSLGGVHYSKGTAVRIRFDPDTGTPASWLLSPNRAAAATRDDGEVIRFGHAVAHDANGGVTATMRNDEAGFFRALPVRAPGS